MKVEKKKYLNALNDFPSEDLKGFDKYLKSPLLNSNKKLIQLFSLRSRKGLTVQSCYEHLYPGKKTNEQVVKNLVSQLKAQYNKYLAIKTVLNNEQLFDSLVLEEISKREKLDDSWSLKYHPDFEYNLLEHSLNLFSFLEGNVISDYETLERAKSSSLSVSNLLKYQSSIIDSSYYVKKCIIFINYFVYKRKQPGAQSIVLIEKKLSIFEEAISSKKEEIIELYKLAYFFEKDQNEKAYCKLFKKFNSLNESTHLDHFNFIWTLLANFCIAKANSGKHSYEINAFELFEQFLLKNKTSTLREITINNYVKLGVRVKRQEQVQRFLSENKPYFGVNAYSYCSALLSYHSGNYHESLSILQKVKFSSSYYKFNSKSMIIENFMNLNELDAASYAIDSLIISMKRSKKKLHTSYKHYYPYYNFLRQIIKLKSEKHSLSKQEYQKSATSLIEDINEEKNLPQRKYLIKHLL